MLLALSSSVPADVIAKVACPAARSSWPASRTAFLSLSDTKSRSTPQPTHILLECGILLFVRDEINEHAGGAGNFLVRRYPPPLSVGNDLNLCFTSVCAKWTLSAEKDARIAGDGDFCLDQRLRHLCKTVKKHSVLEACLRRDGPLNRQTAVELITDFPAGAALSWMLTFSFRIRYEITLR